MLEFLKTIPMTITVTLGTLVLFQLPELAALFEYDVLMSPLHQIQGLFGSHLLHWSADHLFWDLGMFVLFGVICERNHPFATLVAIIASAILIPMFVGVFHPNVVTYRGLSGLDTALFSLAAVNMGVERFRESDRLGIALSSGLFLGMILKIASECVSGGTMFVESGSFTPVPIAHVIGAVVGLVCAAWISIQSRVEVQSNGGKKPTSNDWCTLDAG